MTIVLGDIDAKKTRKTFHKVHMKLFLNFSLRILYCSEHLVVQNFCKKSFSGNKIRKNGIPVIKITFSLKKNSPELQVSMS